MRAVENKRIQIFLMLRRIILYSARSEILIAGYGIFFIRSVSEHLCVVHADCSRLCVLLLLFVIRESLNCFVANPFLGDCSIFHEESFAFVFVHSLCEVHKLPYERG